MSIHSPGETSTKHIFLRWAIEKPLFDHTTFYLKHVLLHSFERKNFLSLDCQADKDRVHYKKTSKRVLAH